MWRLKSIQCGVFSVVLVSFFFLSSVPRSSPFFPPLSPSLISLLLSPHRPLPPSAPLLGTRSPASRHNFSVLCSGDWRGGSEGERARGGRGSSSLSSPSFLLDGILSQLLHFSSLFSFSFLHITTIIGYLV